MAPPTSKHALDAIGTRPDGNPYAPWTYRRYRGVLYSTLTLAKTRKLIGANPLDGRAPERRKVNHAVDPRAVPSLAQARALLAAVAGQGKRGRTCTRSSPPCTTPDADRPK